MKRGLVVPPPHDGPPVAYEELLENARAQMPASLSRNASEVMLALDVDGTLLRHDGPSERISRLVHEAIEAGVNLVIATGRGVASTRPVFESLRLPDGYSVCSNGAQTAAWSRSAGQYRADVVHEHAFDPEPAARVLADALPGLLFGVDAGAERMLVTQLFPAGEIGTPQVVCSFDRAMSSPTPRMVARAPWLSRDEFDAAVSELPLQDYSVAVGWTAWADVCAPGVSKALGLSALCERLDVKVENVVAMGDGSNDIEMLAWAGHSVAMGGASEQVVQAAKATTGAVDHDGSAAVIEALLERF